MLRTLKLTLAYDGTAYAGWQRQANALAVQAVVEDALAALFGVTVSVVGAGRTDAGVHAAGQVASLVLDHPIPCEALVRALNTRLPADIRVRRVEEAEGRFNARADAVAKTYRYAMWSDATSSPFIRDVAWYVPRNLDTDRMAAAAGMLVGQHDFSAFQAVGGDTTTTRRRLFMSKIVRVDAVTAGGGIWYPDDGAPAAASLIRYEVTGNGFLRHMVRIIVGTLVDIGVGRLPVEAMAAIVASGDRTRAGMTAPPHGLTLWRVDY